MTMTWTMKKPMAAGRGGIVSAQHETAARAGAAVLARGGNAVDAAVTCALVLSVVEPWLSGIGGGGFLIRRDGATGKTETLDFNMRASRHADPADYPLVAGRDGDWFDWPQVKGNRNLIGGASVAVPGAVAGFAAALERHGTISWAEALAPAIEEAEKGLRVDWFTELCLAIDADNLTTDATSAALYLTNGKPRRIPEGKTHYRLPLTAKAATLRRLAEAGWQDFYEGQIARALVADLAAAGSRIDATDLAAAGVDWAPPLTLGYRGHEILAMPGLSGGPAYADALAQIESAAQVGGSARPEAGAYAAYARACRAAYATRLKTAGAAASREMPETAPADPGCTSHLSVVDAAGTVVVLTNTLLSRFGSKVTSPGTGVLLNNGMMWFDPRPGQPNSVAPGVKPLANMCPVILRPAGGGTIGLGAAGGRQIMPTIVQLTSFCLDYGMDLSAALSQPRIDASTPVIRVDRDAPEGTLARIRADLEAELVENVLYPVQFAIPGAVAVDTAGAQTGMVHPNHPWSASVRAEDVSA